VEASEAREATAGPSSAYGTMLRDRANGCFRGLYVQLNNTSTRTTTNVKSAKLCDIIRQYDPHVIGLNEVGRNHSKYRSSERLSSFITELHRESRSLAAYNELEKDISSRKYQPGGTGILVLDELIPYSRRGQVDPRKLGRWTSYIIEGKNGHCTRFVQGYSVGRNRSDLLASHYQQVLRYIQKHNLRTTPRKLFEDDFLHQLRVWRLCGERLIVMLDANENVSHGAMCSQFSQEGIDLRNSTIGRHGGQADKPHAQGSEPIDGLWHTPDTEMTEVKWLSFEESPGDHRACVFEFTTQSTMGNFEQRIVYPPCRICHSSD
jgi:hypothetical protein